MLHPKEVTRALYWSNRARLRRSLGIKKRTQTRRVLTDGADLASARYERVCRFYFDHLESKRSFAGSAVCEIGCGNCLASADMLLGLGASHVDLIENDDIVVDEVQLEVLKMCANAPGLPNRNQVLDADGKIDTAKITVFQCFLENLKDDRKYDLMLSFDVGEHVEDIEGFFFNCHRLLNPGGLMIHKIDLSGHEFFEDPMPPLDFQTYPVWLYSLMFPKYFRATRRPQGEYLEVLKKLDFVVLEVGIIRGADLDYIEKLRPQLRKEIRHLPAEELKALDWYVIAQKK